VIAYHLIEASPLENYNRLSPNIATSLKSRSRHNLQTNQYISHNFETPVELNSHSEADLIHLIREQVTSPETWLSRYDLSLAFHPISEPEKSSLYNTSSLEASSFDRTKTIIIEDIAPYIRSIVSYDARLQQDRARLSNLISEGGRKGKRMRTTRSAMSALEGGARSTTRRDRYFGPGLNPYYVLRTGKQSWLDAASERAGYQLDR